MSDRPPTALRAIAAATTPVVAAAVLAVALLATGCEGRLPTASPGPSLGPPSGTPGVTPAPGTPGATPRPEVPVERRLIVAAGAPAQPRLVLRDVAGTGGAARVVDPPGSPALAALAVAPDGSLAVVAPDGRAWRAAAPRRDDTAVAWRAMGRADAPGGLPGPVLGAAWTPDGDALLVAAGDPGSGTRRTVLATLPAAGGPVRAVTVEAEPDGPGIAALPDGAALLALRDARDTAVLARVTAAGTAAFLGQPARTVASGGDLVAVADDRGVVVGDLGALGRGRLPAERLPLKGDAGVAGLAVAPDGAAIAVVRLGDDGRPARIDVLVRAGGTWRAGPTLPLDAAAGNVLLAWVPGA